MGMISCKKGHTYDPAKHTNCPYCGIDIDDFVVNTHKHSPAYSNSKNEAEVYGKTVPLHPMVEEKKEEKKIEPVVGWLVCTKGKCMGQDYRIVAGRNKLGKMDSNDIVVNEDGILLMEHCNIIFDPVSSRFFVALGSGRGLAYKNGTLVMSEEELKAEDHLQVGNVELILVPFCNEQVKW